MNRLQRFIPALAVAALGVWVCRVGFTQEPADAFLFPRLVSAAFVLLALFMLVQTVLGRATPGEGLNRRQVANLIPGFAVMLIHVFWAAETLGFYTATAIAFLILLTLYGPTGETVHPGDTRRNSLRALVARIRPGLGIWARRFLATGAFIAAIYGLFALLLKIYTPRGMFF